MGWKMDQLAGAHKGPAVFFFSKNMKVNSTYEGNYNDNEQRESVDRSSLGSDEVVGSKLT